MLDNPRQYPLPSVHPAIPAALSKGQQSMKTFCSTLIYATALAAYAVDAVRPLLT